MGFVRATDVAPRDSHAARSSGRWTRAPRWLSPNGDGLGDQMVVATRLSEIAAATHHRPQRRRHGRRRASANGDIVRFAWDLRTTTGASVPDGGYTWTFRAGDAWGNAAVSRTGSFTVDGTPPVTKAALRRHGGRNGWIVSAATVTLSATRRTLRRRTRSSWRVSGGSRSDATADRWSSPRTAPGRSSTGRSTGRASWRPGRRSTLKIDTTRPGHHAPGWAARPVPRRARGAAR